jgi:hypothetical protein
MVGQSIVRTCNGFLCAIPVFSAVGGTEVRTVTRRVVIWSAAAKRSDDGALASSPRGDIQAEEHNQS